MQKLPKISFTVSESHSHSVQQINCKILNLPEISWFVFEVVLFVVTTFTSLVMSVVLQTCQFSLIQRVRLKQLPHPSQTVKKSEKIAPISNLTQLPHLRLAGLQCSVTNTETVCDCLLESHFTLCFFETKTNKKQTTHANQLISGKLCSSHL